MQTNGITVLAASRVRHHVQGALQPDLLFTGQRRWRVGCSCGHQGSWERTIGEALGAYASHFNRSVR